MIAKDDSLIDNASDNELSKASSQPNPVISHSSQISTPVNVNVISIGDL